MKVHRAIWAMRFHEISWKSTHTNLKSLTGKKESSATIWAGAVKMLEVLAEIKLKVSQECAWQQGRPHAAGLRRMAIPLTQHLIYHIELLCIVLGQHKEDIDNLEWVHLRATGMLGLQSCYSMRGSCFQRLWSFYLQRFSGSNWTNPWASWSVPTAGPALSKRLK